MRALVVRAGQWTKTIGVRAKNWLTKTVGG